MNNEIPNCTYTSHMQQILNERSNIQQYQQVNEYNGFLTNDEGQKYHEYT